jgi:hypothetical protein
LFSAARAGFHRAVRAQHRSTSINEDLFSGLISGSVENISISDRTDAEIQTGLGIDAETQTGLGIDAETQTDNNHADQQKQTDVSRFHSSSSSSRIYFSANDDVDDDL